MFVPGDVSEKKDSKPPRYVGLRLLKPQGVLFADGSDRKHHAVVSNLALLTDNIISAIKRLCFEPEHRSI